MFPDAGFRPRNAPVRFAYHRGVTRALAAALVLVTAAACGSTAARTSPTPTHRPSPLATPTATPSAAPDTEQVVVSASGFGAYDLQVYPIALLTNEADAHTASQVVVSFTVDFRGGSYQLSAEPVSLGPGQTLAVTALCTDSCQGATGIQASPAVGSWVSGPHSVISGNSAPYVCGSPCAGDPGYEGSVSGTLSGQASAGTLIDVTAVCKNAAGGIVGGGAETTLWAGGDTAPAVVTVLTTTQPPSCQLYATEVS